jgi:hypothetical protein
MHRETFRQKLLILCIAVLDMTRSILNILSVLICLFSASARGAQSSQPSQVEQRHWTETKTEMIWRGQYNNCDYGYYVLLSNGVVAHGTHSPAPNHGFLISLPDPTKTSYVSNQGDHFAWVDASYNVTDYHTLASVADYEVHVMDQERGRSRIVGRSSTRLAGLRALRFKVEYQSSKGKITEEQIIALRSDIVYTVGLRTLRQFRLSDEQVFQQIADGFRLLPLAQGKCSNG